MYEVRESKQGQTVDALALGGDEGRDKLRKARDSLTASVEDYRYYLDELASLTQLAADRKSVV